MTDRRVPPRTAPRGVPAPSGPREPEREDDAAAVARLLGRPPAGAFQVVVRTDSGQPRVIRNAPFLRDGTPMPTTFWLVDPDLTTAVARLESAGGVRQAEAEVGSAAIARAHAEYAAVRDALVPDGHAGPRPTGGVAGTRQGVKCLHAHLAWWLAGGPDPVGAWVVARLGRGDLGQPMPGAIPTGRSCLPPGPRPRRRACYERSMERASHRAGSVAAVDCGTNSTRLLVVDQAGRAVERRMEITRLGQGVDATGRLAPEAIARCARALSGFRAVCDAHGVAAVRMVATSAVRDAANAADFFAAAEAALGAPAELLSGVDEGRLSLAGAVGDLPAGDGPWVVVDIGGGSTEVVVGAAPDDPQLAVRSFQIGCVRLAERLLHHDPPLPAELEAVSDLVDAALAEAPTLAAGVTPAHRMVGLAGTVSTISMLAQRLSTYDRARVHHSVLSAAEVSHWCDVLASDDRLSRSARPGMVEGRVDVIVAGAVILRQVMRWLGSESCLVSEADILDGLVATLR
ncbi:MAG: DUF501 domain-containing protein [Acidimicrobiales bacterium]